MKKACCPCPDVIGTRRWPFIRVPGLRDEKEVRQEAQPRFRELGGHSGQWEPVETAEQGGQAGAFLDQEHS